LDSDTEQEPEGTLIPSESPEYWNTLINTRQLNAQTQKRK